MEYINKRGGDIKLMPIEEPKQSYESIKAAMLEALDMEKSVNEVRRQWEFENLIRVNFPTQ